MKATLIIVTLLGLLETGGEAKQRTCGPKGRRTHHLCRGDTLQCTSQGSGEGPWNATPADGCSAYVQRCNRTILISGVTKGNLACHQVNCKWDYSCRNKKKTLPLGCVDLQKKRELHVNTYLYMSYVYAKDMNVSGCWVCTHIPTHAKGGIPLRPVPLNLSETVEWYIYQNGTRQSPRTIRIASVVRHPDGGAAPSLSFLPISPGPWKEEGYPMNTFEMCYQLSYNRSHQPPFLTLTNTTYMGRPLAIICLVRNVVKGTFVGASQCEHRFVVANISEVYPVYTSPQFYGCTLDVLYANGTGTFKYSLIAKGFDVDKLTSYNGTYFICGHKAYPWLPENWTGSCYLGYVVPFIHHLANLGDHYQMTKRQKRAITETQRYFGILLPPIAVALAMKKIRKIAKILEEVANDTTEALTEINNEMVAIRTIALQNRMAFDYLFANKGGTCAVIGSEHPQ
ncbi:uncharacterized protein [Scyliorhinus torazame]|uniref:uncharacterized protein n=1 Tax=Scyliorhinus torazame TaxID=75743 RepID=UPI003B5CFD48